MPAFIAALRSIAVRKREAPQTIARPIWPPSTTSSMRRPQRRLCARPPLPASETRLHLRRPRTFTLDNTAQAVIGVPRAAAQAMRFDECECRGAVARRLAQFRLDGERRKGLGGGNDRQRFPAASTTAHGDQWQFKVCALRFGSDVYRFIFAAKQKTTESDRNARETVDSFRRLTLDEIQAARPLRVKASPCSPAKPWNRYPAACRASSAPAERFRMLNGLDAHAQVRRTTVASLLDYGGQVAALAMTVVDRITTKISAFISIRRTLSGCLVLDGGVIAASASKRTSRGRGTSSPRGQLGCTRPARRRRARAAAAAAAHTHTHKRTAMDLTRQRELETDKRMDI